MKKEGNIMSIAEKDIISTHPLNSVKNVAKLMKDRDVRRLPVIDGGTSRLLGMATAMDIMDFMGGGPKYNIIVKDYKGNLPAAVNCPIEKIMREATFLDKSASVEDAANIMSKKHTSAIPIVESAKDKTVIAIVTERDVMPQADYFGITVEEVMKTDPITSSLGMMISDVSKIMVRNGFRRLPVIQEGKLIGVVTVFDVLKFLGYGEFQHTDAEEAFSERVDEIMSKEVITVTEDQDLSDVAKLVKETGIGGFPVVEKGCLAGIVTISDIIKAVYR
ncbi:MAG: CBS domain-containing protein [Candidatus Altiarchaeia archaeon]